MTRVLSGDQSVVWDALLKLLVLKALGKRVFHDVHTADYFSRPPASNNNLAVTKETYNPDGNVARWTASLEGVPFLGRMPISPECFTLSGVDFARVGSFNGDSLERVVARLTEADWLGMSAGPANRAAHGIPVAELLTEYPKLRKPLRDDISGAVREEDREEATRAFDRVWRLAQFAPQSWGEASVATLRANLDHFGVNGEVELTTSYHIRREPSYLFHIFVENYAVAREAYNTAVRTAGEYIPVLRDGQLPFYAIVQQGGDLIRVDLEYQAGETPQRLLVRVQGQHGKVHAVVGKAIPCLVEILMKGSMVLPEGGSVYWPKSARFARELEVRLGISLGLQPLLTLKLNALDALEDVTAEFRLPEYLRPAFGTEWISGVDFARSWRGVVDTGKDVIRQLSGKDLTQVAGTLVARGLLGGDAAELLTQLSRQSESFARQSADLFAPTRDSGLAKDARNELTARANKARGDLALLMEPSLFKAAELAVLAGVEARRASALRDQLAIVKSLPYWNQRPFTHWVLAVPGWLDAIKRRAELVEQAFLPPEA